MRRGGIVRGFVRLFILWLYRSRPTIVLIDIVYTEEMQTEKRPASFCLLQLQKDTNWSNIQDNLGENKEAISQTSARSAKLGRSAGFV